VTSDGAGLVANEPAQTQPYTIPPAQLDPYPEETGPTLSYRAGMAQNHLKKPSPRNGRSRPRQAHRHPRSNAPRRSRPALRHLPRPSRSCRPPPPLAVPPPRALTPTSTSGMVRFSTLGGVPAAASSRGFLLPIDPPILIVPRWLAGSEERRQGAGPDEEEAGRSLTPTRPRWGLTLSRP
jgi:hypothetical protein